MLAVDNYHELFWSQALRYKLTLQSQLPRYQYRFPNQVLAGDWDRVEQDGVFLRELDCIHGAQDPYALARLHRWAVQKSVT